MATIFVGGHLVGISLDTPIPNDRGHLFLLLSEDDTVSGDDLIIRGGPEYDFPPFGAVSIAKEGTQFKDSEDDPVRWGETYNISDPKKYYGYTRLELTGSASASDIWNTFTGLAQQISSFSIDYDAIYQNYNSVAATLLAAVGIEVPKIEIDGIEGKEYIYPGAGHYLNYDWLSPLTKYKFEIDGRDGADDILYALDGARNDISLPFTAGNNLNGFGGDDILHGGARANLLSGGSGDDKIYGAGGTDTALFSGSFVEYNFVRFGTFIDLRGRDGHDVLDRVEVLQFGDQPLDLSDLPNNVFVRDGSQIAHNYDLSVGRQAVTNNFSESTFWFKRADFGLSFLDLQRKSVRDCFLDIFSSVELINSKTDSNIESNSAERPAFYELISSKLEALFLDTNYSQIGIVGVGAVNISDVIGGEPASDDHGDTIPSATNWAADSVGAAEVISGEIETGSDADVFSVNVAAGTEYTFFSLANITTYTELDTILDIYDAHGNRVAWNDNSVLGLSSFIRWTPDASGTYYVKVSSFGGTVGNYTLYGSDQSSNGNAGNLIQTDEPALPSFPSYWHWEGDDGDDYPSHLTLEQGGAPSVEEDNRYRGHGGNDVIYSDDGDDVVYGDDGDDQLFGENGDDTLLGGNGDDSLFGGDDDDQLHGEDGDDHLEGGDGDDYVHGWLGNDVVYGDDGDDYLKGGDGVDTLSGGNGNDEIYGDGDDDLLRGELGNDLLFGGSGDDVLRGNSGDDRLAGEEGNDFLQGDLGDDELYGGLGNDILKADWGNDVLNGEEGNDTADFSEGELGETINLFDNFAVSEDLGRDVLYSIENIIGSNGNDSIDGNHERNLLVGGLGDDLIRGHNADDQVYGGEGNDIVWGDEGNDIVTGDQGDDEVRGGLGNDTLYGGEGDDELRGEQGNDIIYGGLGTDAAFFWGEREDFGITLNQDGSYRVQDLRSDGQEGVDTVYGVEIFRFFDGDITTADILSTAPTATHDEVSTTEDEAILFEATLNDSDAEGNELFVSAVDAEGQKIYAEMVDGKIVIDPKGVFDYLDSGETASLSITYTVSDGTGFSDTSDVAITILGAKETVLLSEIGRDYAGTKEHEDIVGTGRNDRVSGGRGNDILRGFGGNDRLLGADDADQIFGGKGSDFMSGGKGNDVLSGNGQGDIFEFAEGFDKDAITDFQHGKDIIDLRSFDLSPLNSFATSAFETERMSGLILGSAMNLSFRE